MTDNEALNEIARILQRFETEWIGPTTQTEPGVYDFGWPMSVTFCLHAIVIALCWQYGLKLWKYVIYVKNHRDIWALLLCLALPCSAMAQDITSGKVHDWDLFEDTADTGGSAGSALTIVGSLTVSGERVTGFSSSSRLTMPSLSGLNGATAYTISFWCNSPSRTANPASISLGGTAASHADATVIYSHNSSGGAATVYSNGSSKITGHAGYPATGVDSHVVFVVESSTSAKLYVDGVFRGGSTGNCTMPASVTQGVIGAYYGGTTQFHAGSIGQVKIFNRALTSTEVGALKEADEMEMQAFRNPPDDTPCGVCDLCYDLVEVEPSDGSVQRFVDGFWQTVVNEPEGYTIRFCSSGLSTWPIRRIAGDGSWTIKIQGEAPCGKAVTWSGEGPSGTVTVKSLGCCDNNDGDTLCDEDDCDDDNDGQDDVDEDDDEDGIPNDEDPDDDNDGCLDNEDCEDDDEDGLANCEDPDDDNDGAADHIDCDWYGEVGGCEDEPAEDTDGDGTPDNTDPDDDNDGIGDWADADDDGDGIPDDDDPDFNPDDEDGGPTDTDGDGDPDWRDDDDDGDGIPDADDPDDDNDGLPDDEDEPPPDGPAPCDGGGGGGSSGEYCCPVGASCDGLQPCSSMPGDCCEGDSDCDGDSDDEDDDDDDDGTPDDEDDDDDGDGTPDDDDGPGGPGDGECECCDDLLFVLGQIKDQLDGETADFDPDNPVVQGSGAHGRDFNGQEVNGDETSGEHAYRFQEQVDEAARELATGSKSTPSAEARPFGHEDSGVPGVDKLTWPIPPINAELTDYEFCFTYTKAWGTTLTNSICLHSLPLLNIPNYPEATTFLNFLEATRIFLRYGAVALGTLKAWAWFGKLFRDLLGT